MFLERALTFRFYHKLGGHFSTMWTVTILYSQNFEEKLWAQQEGPQYLFTPT